MSDPHMARSHLVGYIDAEYMSDPHMARSQTSYVFTVGGIAIPWRSTKQTLVVTSLNHVEILALHEASRECFWLRAVIEHIRSTSDLTFVIDLPTMIFEGNATCIKQGIHQGRQHQAHSAEVLLLTPGTTTSGH
ncbi:hypothetical protein ACFX10_022963 [Malus domestica]